VSDLRALALALAALAVWFALVLLLVPRWATP
jgi:hypothetical protein